MSVPRWHVFRQGEVIRSMVQVSLSRYLPGSKRSASQEQPEYQRTLEPRAQALVRDYTRHACAMAGADPGLYRGVLPPHMFPQWCMALSAQTLTGLSYPLTKVVNGGCKLIVRAPLPANEPISVRAKLVHIDDDGYRAVLEQRIVTGTRSAPDALEARLFVIVPLKRKEGPKKERARVPSQARELRYFRLSATTGLDFAKLTGDFNPIHWVPAYAKASGFRSVILHGFAQLAYAMEGLRALGRVQQIEVRFTRPLVLPAKVGLYVLDDQIFLGDAPGGPAYLSGTFGVRSFDERLSS